MSWDADRILLAGLIEIQLPTRTLRFCDGGFVFFRGEKFQSVDPEFGGISGFDGIEETIGDEAPGAKLTFVPAKNAAAVALSQPAYQLAPIRIWMVEVDPQTGVAIDATAELLADALLDTTEIIRDRGVRELQMELIAAAERLMTVNEGNTLSARFHKSVWPGELGMDNATGVGSPVAWRVKSPPRGSSSGGGYGGGGGGNVDRGGGGYMNEVVAQ